MHAALNAAGWVLVPPQPQQQAEGQVQVPAQALMLWPGWQCRWNPTPAHRTCQNSR